MVRTNPGAWADANQKNYVDEFIVNFIVHIAMMFGFKESEINPGVVKNKIGNFARILSTTRDHSLLASKCVIQSEECILVIAPQLAKSHSKSLLMQEAISITSRKMFEMIYQAANVKDQGFDAWYSELLKLCDKNGVRGNLDKLGGKEYWRRDFLDNACPDDIWEGLRDQSDGHGD